jgi:hypothetical protein
MLPYEKYLKFGEVHGVARITGTVEFGSEPHLLRFGDDITFADGVRSLRHNGAVAPSGHEYTTFKLSVPSPSEAASSGLHRFRLDHRVRCNDR